MLWGTTTDMRSAVIALLLAVVVLIALAVPVAIFWSDIVEVFKSDEDRVSVLGSFDPRECSKETPVRIDIRNKSKKTIRSVTTTVSVYERGNSRDLGSFQSNPEFTHIVAPGQEVMLCGPLLVVDGKLPDDPIVIVKKLWTTFYGDGEQIPH